MQKTQRIPLTWTAAVLRSTAFFVPLASRGQILDYTTAAPQNVFLERYQTSADPQLGGATALLPTETTGWAAMRSPAAGAAYIYVTIGVGPVSVPLANSGLPQGLPSGWYRLCATVAPGADEIHHVQFD